MLSARESKINLNFKERSLREIPLTKSKVALVDDEDFDLVSEHSWYAHDKRDGGLFYARASISGGRKILMHNLVLGESSPDNQIDHRNGNGLDNRRINLRFATPQQNRRNQKLRSNNTSGYKGVSWHKKAGKWMAYITPYKKRLYLGLFINKEEAARVYDNAAKKYFGEFARLNFGEDNNHG
jgi:AP2 domain/HNH endonuclease